MTDKDRYPVVAIGLDAAQPPLLEQWMAEGKLENLRRFRERATYGSLENFKDSNVETAWTTFATGCAPQTTGYWAALGLKEGTYETQTYAAYDYKKYPPFMALGENYRVATVDVPQLRLDDGINGVQLAGYGAHSPQVPSQTKPPEMWSELLEKHGSHPGLHDDYTVCLDIKGTLKLRKKLETGIARRTAICQDLLKREPWDLFLTVFGETHGGGHAFWHLSQPEHPLYEAFSHIEEDPLLAMYQGIDTAIATILQELPEQTRVVLFSGHGMGPATIDLPSFVFLPEFLYRYSFPGQCALDFGEPGSPLPPLITKMQWNYWERHVWGTLRDSNPVRRFLRTKTPTKLFNLIEPWLERSTESGLVSPFELQRQGERVVPWNPAQWYKPLWPQMKAFAIPSFSEGFVRINLKGREPNGIVEPSEYNQVCDELTEKLYALKEPRTGIPMVSNVVRPRRDGYDRTPGLPEPDLLVVWQEEYASDMMDSPDYGRFGPLPPYRAGSHRARGFIMAAGPGIPEGETLTSGHVVDLAPTLLELMGAPIADHLEGKPLPLITREVALP